MLFRSVLVCGLCVEADLLGVLVCVGDVASVYWVGTSHI